PSTLPATARMSQRRHSMNASMVDAAAWSVMFGIGEMLFPAFVLALALGEVAAGLIATIPPVVGALVQLLSPWGVGRLGSHKRWVIWTAAIQAAAFVPLAIGAALGAMPAWLVFVLVTIYGAAGMAGGAAWSTWIGTIVPRRVRPQWFGKRQRLIQAFMFIGFGSGTAALALTTGGVAPKDFSRPQDLLTTFAVLFVIAGAARLISLSYLAKKHEPEPVPEGHTHVSLPEIGRRLVARSEPTRPAAGADVRLLLGLLLFTCALSVANPFVNPFLLEQLRQPYLAYALLIGAVMIGKVTALTVMGAYAKRHGARAVLRFGLFGLIPAALLWLVPVKGGDLLPWLVFVQFFTGLVMGCYELATWLILLDTLKDRERTSLVSWYFLFNMSAQAVGSVLGAWILGGLGKDHAAYMWVFGASAAARLLAALALLALTVGLGLPHHRQGGR
ncbi:MAG: MFS transporter, partial [Phycisphaerales bacterium]|nr:MFS transporter [Phycisphaerales bacterium]